MKETTKRYIAVVLLSVGAGASAGAAYAVSAWYLVPFVAFVGADIYAYRQLVEARQRTAQTEPSEDYLRGVKDAQFIPRKR